MKFIILAFLLLSSCSSFDNMKRYWLLHDKMALQMDTRPYEMSLPELQKKLIVYLEEEKIFGNKMVWVSTTGQQNIGEDQAALEAMNDGFIYKNNLYTSTVDIDFRLFKMDSDAMKKHFFKNKFHVLESDEQSFMIVKANNIYEGVKEGDGKSYLRIHRLSKVVRPLTLNLDWVNLLKGKGALLDIARGSVDLKSSRDYQVRNRALELSVFFAIDEARANKIEEEIKATM